jgi:hypothetical protein
MITHRPATAIVPTALLLALVLLLPDAPKASGAGAPACTVTIHYQGRDKVDISYSFDGDGAAVALEAVHASAGTRVVAGPAPAGSGKLRLAGLAAGRWTLRLNSGEACHEFTLEGEISGTPQEDETIDGGTAACQSRLRSLRMGAHRP